MIKKILLCICLYLSFSLIRSVNAEEFKLLKISTLNVNGKYYSHWWYSNVRPVFEGTGSRGANIDITIDSEFKTVKASTIDGTWKFTPDHDLEKKDHSVTIASGEEKISFILTIGSTEVPADANSTGKISQLPETGNLLPSIVLVTLAVGLIYYGIRGKLV